MESSNTCNQQETTLTLKGWKHLLDPDQIKYAIEKCASKINKDLSNCSQELVCICILKGAAYFFVDLTRLITIPHTQVFMSASSYRGAQQSSVLTIQDGGLKPSDVVGKTILLVDELFDTGKTLTSISNYLVGHLGVDRKDILTCTAFVKRRDTEGNAGALSDNLSEDGPDYYGVITPNVWLVGYGLDDNEKCRNYRDLWAVPKVKGIEETKDDKMFSDKNIYKLCKDKMINQLTYDCMTRLASDYAREREMRI